MGKMTPTPNAPFPPILRCCGYKPRRGGPWVGYCLELHLREQGRDWEEVLEKLMLAASLHLGGIQRTPGARVPGKAPFRMRLCYTYIALLHFIRPHGPRCLADLSSALLVH